ncbi:O-linked N-acetylglucosamine transferase, SPINDLY family protein [Candidatus Synechococcus calcipolaris G9]|uniref:O-linked N-acetylglucosamine transferase, SPINDLY family protein n=1 Tax=Candidatus Synechococcus calcipolaris G9 TaxID=1497997 RepID=A0ABT6F0P8_9SYNE|nr:O-linked N-acetylglucosamine transferase, SPINDLY family protein [Candidatus Synechococcus calcipolaris]MDG2991436.1 O-linked N-acetylglucosamine transferase, SPINDLY family protein [Candidatus Synechococcus calcipolaris G9]
MDALDRQDYAQVIEGCQKTIEIEPLEPIYYGYLGLALLLQGEETEAQMAWMAPILEESVESIESYYGDLINILESHATAKEDQQQWMDAWLIRGYIQEFQPDNIKNSLALCQLAFKQECFSWDSPQIEPLTHLISQATIDEINVEQLQDVLDLVLSRVPGLPQSFNFVEQCLVYADYLPKLLPLLRVTARNLGFGQDMYSLAIDYAELGRQAWPKDPTLLSFLSGLYRFTRDYEKSIGAAKDLFALQEELADRLYANHAILQSLVAAGSYEQEIKATLEHQNVLLGQLLQEWPLNLERHQVRCLFILLLSPPHLEDRPQYNKPIFNQLMSLCQENIEIYGADKRKKYQAKTPAKIGSKKIKIGFLSTHLKRHAIGFLAWGLYEYFNGDRFEFNTYYGAGLPQKPDAWQSWYIKKSNKVFYGEHDSYKLADKINEDKIDILIDLDSVTLDLNCEILALKPAPIQISWLGFDASGLPAVDYFLGDPYVLPEQAQSYYSEKIWRLPHTYVAVNGFTANNPTVHRQDFDISSDAVIFLTSQRAAKRNRRMTELQMQILGNVPHSYLFIKGAGQQDALQAWFLEIAESMGITGDRLRFLPLYPSDEEHRGNLPIADVVLDTYPYNGATTTLEVLWMEIPLVTRVGKQFASRNSYTFLVNAGVSEGIAWTDEEYVEWGIRLGTDEDLRKQVTWKLKKAKHHSPLWNARQFTQEVESAFQSMWHYYVTGDLELPSGHTLG